MKNKFKLSAILKSTSLEIWAQLRMQIQKIQFEFSRPNWYQWWPLFILNLHWRFYEFLVSEIKVVKRQRVFWCFMIWRFFLSFRWWTFASTIRESLKAGTLPTVRRVFQTLVLWSSRTKRPPWLASLTNPSTYPTGIVSMWRRKRKT